MKVLLTCRKCDLRDTLEVEIEDYFRWKGGELIQNVWPHFTASQRETLISGICGKCFDELFPPEPE